MWERYRLRRWCAFVFCQAEDGIRELVRSRGVGDVYKRQVEAARTGVCMNDPAMTQPPAKPLTGVKVVELCLLYTLTLPTTYSVYISEVAVTLKKKTQETRLVR